MIHELVEKWAAADDERQKALKRRQEADASLSAANAAVESCLENILTALDAIPEGPTTERFIRITEGVYRVRKIGDGIHVSKINVEHA